MVIVTKIRTFFLTFTITTLMIWCKLFQRNHRRSRRNRKMRGSDQSQDTSFQSHIFEKWERFSKVAKMTIFGSVVNYGDEFQRYCSLGILLAHAQFSSNWITYHMRGPKISAKGQINKKDALVPGSTTRGEDFQLLVEMFAVWRSYILGLLFRRNH